MTITQSSAIWELRAAAPEQSRPALFSSAMRIGRDHIASTICTIVFAYAGAALAVLLLLVLYDRPLLDLLTTESISGDRPPRPARQARAPGRQGAGGQQVEQRTVVEHEQYDAPRGPLPRVCERDRV